MSCPNINSREWKDLVALGGEELAYKIFALDPTLESVDVITKQLSSSKYNVYFTLGNSKQTRFNRLSNRGRNEDKFREVVADAVERGNSENNMPASFKQLIQSGSRVNPSIEYVGLTTPDGMINKFRQQPLKPIQEHIKEEVEELYKNVRDGEEIKPNDSAIPLTKEDYLEYRLNKAESAANRGKVQELVLTLPLIEDETAYNNASQELADLFEKINQFKQMDSIIRNNTNKVIQINEKWFGWILKDENIAYYVSKLFRILGIHEIIDNKDSTIRYSFQVPMNSQILGVKSVIDMLIQHKEHSYSIIDFKAGQRFASMTNSIPLKYYRRANIDITDNPQNIAKLQIMWEAILTRINDPQAKFENLMAVWIPDESAMHKSGTKFHVDPKEFLPMIEMFLMDEMKDKYDTLIAIDPNLFDPSVYMAESDAVLAIRNRLSSSKKDIFLDDLTQEVIYRQKFMDYSNYGSKYIQDEKIRDLLDVINQAVVDNAAKTMPFLRGHDFKNIRDLSLGEYWIGSAYNIKHPVVSSVLEVEHEQLLKASKAFQEDSSIFKQLIIKMAIEYVKYAKPGSTDNLRNILADPASNISITLKKILGSYNSEILNGWIYRDYYDKDTNTTIKVLATTEKELIENVKNDSRFSWIMEGDKVKKPFIDIMNFLNDRYSKILDPKRTDSLWNKQLSYRIKKERGKIKKIPITYGNEINSSEVRKNSPFVYIAGWFPKVAKLESEFDYKDSFKFRQFFRKYLTNFYELVFDEQHNNTEVIPLRGLGNIIANMENEYSFSLENQFETFMKSAYAKIYLTPAHSFIESIKIKNMDKSTGEVLLPNLQKWLDAHQDLALRGRRPELVSPFSRALPFTFGFNSKETNEHIRILQTFDLGKALLSLGKLTAYIRLGFNIPGGLKNALGIMFSSFTEASKQSIMKRLYDDPKYTSFVNDFTTMGASEFGAALGPSINMQVSAMKGQLNQNKLWVLMNQFNYIPSISPLRKEQKYFVTDSYKLGSTNMALLPYSTAEEVLIGTFFRAQMEHIKVEQGPMKGKSLWDMYEEVTKIDPATGIEYKTWEYKKDENGKPYVRGIIIDSNGNREELTELSNKEVMAMHAIYEEKQGGFAQLDRSFLEASILGQVLIQFRRHLQSVLRHGLMTHGENYIKGRYQNTGKTDEDGNTIYEFKAKAIEGKWMTLLGMIMYYTPTISKIFGKDTKVSKFIDNNFPKGLDEYAWDKLDQGQKENILDMGLNISVWALMKAVQYLAFGSAPDPKDKMYQWSQKIINETLQHWKIWQMYQDINQTPASMKVLASILSGTAQISLSYLLYGVDGLEVIDIDDKEYLTKDKELRGSNEFSGTLPVFTSLRTTWQHAESAFNLGDEEDE